MPRTRSNGNQEEEMEALQKRFSNLSNTQKTFEEKTSLLLATRKSSKALRAAMAAANGQLTGSALRIEEDRKAEEELKKLDAQIDQLRRKHDTIHQANEDKRAELSTLADKLKDLNKTKFNPVEQTPEGKLEAALKRLESAAARYDSEHRFKMSYAEMEQRLKKEQLEWPDEIKQLESIITVKERDYEALLVMSHDANSSKEAAKTELAKFEALVLEERKAREKELMERRMVLQKKQGQASELDRADKERKAAMKQAEKAAGEDPLKVEGMKMEALIKEEHGKIAAYEQAFQLIKEATGVTDVNEVIARFLNQEETHQSLLAMTKEAQGRIDKLRGKVEDDKLGLMTSEYTVANGDEAASNQSSDSSQLLAAQTRLIKAKEKSVKLIKTAVNTKSAVSHIVDLLEPLREKDEVVAPMSDDSLLQHLQFAESKIEAVASAYFEMEDNHRELMSGMAEPLPSKAPTLQKENTLGLVERGKDSDASDQEFDEDVNDEVLDRLTLKAQSSQVFDKGTKRKNKPKKSATAAAA